MADTAAASPIPDEDEESLASFSTLFLALVTLFIYVLFLKPTAQNEETNNDNNGNTANNRTRERQRQRAGRRVPPQQQAPLQAQQPTRRRLQLSDNALEILSTCQSLPPHVTSSTKIKSIGGFEILAENGLVSFSSTKVAAKSKQQLQASQDASLQQRKERAKILSRLFAATHKDFGKTPPAPPSKGSTFVVGISKEKHLLETTQRSSLIRVLRGLSAHYTVLVVVSVDPSSNSNTSSYEPTQALQSEAVRLLRGDDELSESVLPSHRVLLAGSATGKVALVRQLSTNIGLTVDFERSVQDELERFGYDVSIVEDWTTILPSTNA